MHKLKLENLSSPLSGRLARPKPKNWAACEQKNDHRWACFQYYLYILSFEINQKQPVHNLKHFKVHMTWKIYLFLYLYI